MTNKHQSDIIENVNTLKLIHLDAIIKTYDQDKYKSFASKVKEVTSSILDSKEIRIHSITYRGCLTIAVDDKIKPYLLI